MTSDRHARRRTGFCLPIPRSSFIFHHFPLLRRRRANGFTLVELMVVVTVIAILVGALLPEFGGTLATMQISTTAGQLGDMMAFCYSAAAAQLANYRLNFDPEMGSAWVTREVELETGEREYQPVQFPGTQSYLLPETVRFDADEMEQLLNAGDEGTYYIQFRRDGTADFCRLTLASLRANPMEISLNGLTGRVIVREMPLEELTEKTE